MGWMGLFSSWDVHKYDNLGDAVMDTHSRLKKIGLNRQALSLKRRIQILLDEAEDQILNEERIKSHEFDALEQNPPFDLQGES